MGEKSIPAGNSKWFAVDITLLKNIETLLRIYVLHIYVRTLEGFAVIKG
jgi:hypothetical protein